MKKKILIILFILFIFKSNALALKYGGCEYSDVSKMKQLTTNINVTYTYKITNNIAYYDVTLTNLTKDMYIVDSVSKQKYYSFPNGELTIRNHVAGSVTFKVYSNKSECKGILLGSKYASLPVYNIYHSNDICKNLDGFLYCKKWGTKTYTYAEVKKAVDDYYDKMKREERVTPKPIHIKTFWEKLLDFYIKYYIIILISIVALSITGIQIRKRKNRFKL